MYIGQTKDFKTRKRQHFRKLNTNKHFNLHLQFAFNKYGENNFIFEIIEVVNVKFLDDREQYYIDLYGITSLYNIAPIAGHAYFNPEKLEKAIAKRKETNILRYNQNPNNKKVAKIDKDTNDIVSQYDSLTAAALSFEPQASFRRKTDIIGKISQVCRGKRGTAFGYKWKYIDIKSIEFEYKSTRQISDYHKSIMQPVQQINKETNEIIKTFRSCNNAQNETKIKHIHSCCNGKRKSSGGFIWKYVE